MASLSMQFLSAMGIDEDKGQQICERHKEVLKEVITERDKFKEEAEKLPQLQKQLENYKEAEKKAAENGEKDPYKVKYEAVKEEFEAFKKDIAAKEATAKKESAYKQLLKNAGVSEKRIDSILKVTNLDGLEFGDDGQVKDSDKLTESIKTEWADFIQTEGIEGAKTATPPTVTTTPQDLGKLSMAEYIEARQKMN